MVSSEERLYLRDLAREVREIAAQETWTEKRLLWTDLINLRGKRTMVTSVFTDDTWRELLGGEATLRVSDPLLRIYEYDLKKRIFRWKHLRDDTVLTSIIYVPIEYKFTDWVENRRRPFDDIDNLKKGLRKAERYHPFLLNYSDIKRLRKPELSHVDMKNTDQQFEKASDVFGDILDVVKGEPFSASRDSSVFGWGLSMIDVACELRGLEQVYYDIYDAPEFLHELMGFLQRAYIDYLDTLEREHLLFPNNVGYVDNGQKSDATAIGENGLGITDLLPSKDFDATNVRTKDLWGYLMEQEFEPVSAEHRYSFVMKYQQPIAARFGMIAYGCCENNDKSYDYMFESFPNLRVVSVPYVSNLELAVERLQNHVMAWRPLATIIENYDSRRVHDFTQRGLAMMKENNAVMVCSSPLTLRGRNESIELWIQDAMSLSRYYGHS